MKHARTIVGLVVIAFLLIIIWFLITPPTSLDHNTTTTSTTIPEHHGSSTHGNCSANDDCIISGCNNEICQSKFEEPMMSICVYNPPYPKDLGYECRCTDKKCMWII